MGSYVRISGTSWFTIHYDAFGFSSTAGMLGIHRKPNNSETTSDGARNTPKAKNVKVSKPNKITDRQVRDQEAWNDNRLQEVSECDRKRPREEE